VSDEWWIKAYDRQADEDFQFAVSKDTAMDAKKRGGVVSQVPFPNVKRREGRAATGVIYMEDEQ
jgi:hypothetical protein